MKDSQHLQWIHDKLINVYNENKNADYLVRLREIIKETKHMEEVKEFVRQIPDLLSEDILSPDLDNDSLTEDMPDKNMSDGDISPNANKPKKLKYTCNLCGRDNFDRPSPHICNRNFRKRGLTWEVREE